MALVRSCHAKVSIFAGSLSHGFVEGGFEVIVVGGEDDEVDVVALGLPHDGEGAQDVDALLALALDDLLAVGAQARPAVDIAAPRSSKGACR